ncbi:hypothetical protein LTR47_009907 [Exophiala xenobiotica]|nr:hypothetical protein LTR47_009907 [Exophiala xenobiotica]KAK5243932.1 hypothetical protein LTS06_010408 [Exophiala xenobiotica]KAK5282184.1 hypothetical protein LTR40_003666 [Exophiala xenobiotica]KAK5361454.1 hypothetical protein LTS03_010407 [Exophiala xenobiotica]KAK5378756.1 hypothetical protein LTR11_004451 [Exophiala xenobiotica]
MSSPNLDPDFALLLPGVKNEFNRLWDLPLQEMKSVFRESTLTLPASIPDLSAIDVTMEKIQTSDGARLELQIYTPKSLPPGPRQLPLFLVTHGGGWVVGGHGSEEGLTRLVCVQNQCVVVSVDYRMAPEYPFPYALNDSFDALKWCKAHGKSIGINTERIIVGGTSAGGNLAVGLALRSRDEGITGIVGQVLCIPALCHPDFFPRDKFKLESYEASADAAIVSGKLMRWFWNLYMPEPSPDPYASPLLAPSLKGLPPTLIQVAELDPLRDEGMAGAGALQSAGVHVRLEVYKGLPHGFYQFPSIKQVERYYGVVIDFINYVLGRKCVELENRGFHSARL